VTSYANLRKAEAVTHLIPSSGRRKERRMRFQLTRRYYLYLEVWIATSATKTGSTATIGSHCHVVEKSDNNMIVKEM
jgi:hypothetical protein